MVTRDVRQNCKLTGRCEVAVVQASLRVEEYLDRFSELRNEPRVRKRYPKQYPVMKAPRIGLRKSLANNVNTD